MMFPHFWLVIVPLAAQEVPLFTRDFPAEEFAARRAKVYAAIGENAIAVLQGAPSPGGFTRFRQHNDFYYLCGVEAPHAYLLLDGSTKAATTFLPNRDTRREASEGKLFSAEDVEVVKNLTGLDNVLPVSQLAAQLSRRVLSKSGKTLYTPHMPAEGFAVSRDMALRAVADVASDPWDGRPSREGRFLALLRERFPQFEIRDLSPILDKLRLIKSEREISLIRKATRLSELALLEGMRSTKPGIAEYELDAMAKFIFYRNGAQGEAYYSLIASGKNAWFPHYNSGKRAMDAGDLLLFDFAPDVGYYMADVTRMWPVSGQFSKEQKELYGFYLSCYEAILGSIRLHAPVRAAKQEAANRMKQIAGAARFSKNEYQKAARQFVEDYEKSDPDRIGHWVGMSTHDVGGPFETFEPGMVFTIEPQLRVPEEQIHIRLEDMILITEAGVEVLSNRVPRDIESIERLMRGNNGMLQRYPREAEKP